VKYLNLVSREEFAATISAYYSPVEFDECEGYGTLGLGLKAGQQRRKSFALSYRTKLGNATLGSDYGYKIHIVYGAMVSTTSRAYNSISDSAEVPVLSWPITTTPIVIPGLMRSAHIIVDSTKISPEALVELEGILYGTSITTARLPTPVEIISALTDADEFVVTDLGGGMFSITGSLDNILEASPGTYQIVHDTAVVDIDADSSEISSA
jgi:hypothetical protein